jgi:DNA modification methylase
MNDTKQGEQLYEFIAQAFSNVATLCNEAAPVYVWSPPMQEGYEILRGIQSVGIHVQSQLIWKKNTIVLGQADYQWKHEVCWYGWTEGKHHYWGGARDLSTVWDFSKDANQSYVHPTQKPIALSKNAIVNSCRIDGLVLDVFGGSGSTLMGCEQTNRTCYMMELDPKYCDVIRKRYSKFIGKEDSWIQETPVIQ